MAEAVPVRVGRPGEESPPRGRGRPRSRLARLLGTRRRKIIVALLLAAAAGEGLWLLLGTPDNLALLARGRRLAEAGRFAEAAETYERLLAREPPAGLSAPAFLEGARCHECLRQWGRAEALYEACGARHPDVAGKAKVRGRVRGLARVRRYANLVTEKGLAPAKAAEALYEMGCLVREKMNPHAAAPIFSEAAGRFPNALHAPEARHAAGELLLGLGRPAEARDEFLKLVAAWPESRLAGDAQFWIGHTYGLEAGPLLKRGKEKERGRALLASALAAYRKVVDEHPLSDRAKDALLRIGAIQAKSLKDAEAAAGAYRELLEKYPGTPQAVGEQCAVGRHYMKKGEFDRAERLLTLFLASFPNHARAADALLDLAECHRRKGEYVLALDDYNAFLARHPRSARADEVREEIAWLKKYRLE